MGMAGTLAERAGARQRFTGSSEMGGVQGPPRTFERVPWAFTARDWNMPCRGEVWWAFREDRSAMVILSSGGEGDDLLAIYVVPPADQDITGVALELPIGGEEGLASGVVRVGLPAPGRIPCSWLVSLKKDDLIEQAGTLPEEKLAQLGEMLHLGGLER